MLFLISTPIGNLGDITVRSLETLQSVDYILCEDTRKSRILLDHYQIKKPLKSFHKFSEKKEENSIVEDLKRGKNVALISSAGSPAISDPGEFLIKRLIKEKLSLTALPGPSAPISALQLSGLDTTRFQFLGFVPKRDVERKKALITSFYFEGTTLFFESPKRIQKTLREIALLNPQQSLVIVREMTKVHEAVMRGRAKELITQPFRGEIVLLIEGWAKPRSDPKEQVDFLQKTYGLSKQEAIKMTAKLMNIAKKDVYF